VTLNFNAFRVGISITSPVLGLRAIRALRSTTISLPMPVQSFIANYGDHGIIPGKIRSANLATQRNYWAIV
jgi:hypothetical protein